MPSPQALLVAGAAAVTLAAAPSAGAAEAVYGGTTSDGEPIVLTAGSGFQSLISASRAPGTIYGGRTSQDEPVVVRVDPTRRLVTDVLASWHTSTCAPDGLLRFPEHFTGFPIKSTGRFADAFTADYPVDGGGKRHFAYALAGRVTSKTAKGTLKVTIGDADPAGAQTLACDTGGITFKALTG
jgi:hypothetical protein